MSSISPRDEIISLIGSATWPVSLFQDFGRSLGFQKDIVEKVERIRFILTGNPALKEDSEIIDRVFAFTANCTDEKVRDVRKDLLFDSYCKEQGGILKITFPDSVSNSEKASIIQSWSLAKGCLDDNTKTLTFSKAVLNNLTNNEELWNFIENQGVKTLVIRQEDGGEIIYGERVLKQLMKKKPSAIDLAEQYTLKFADNKKLMVPKAKLLLCGEFFERMLSHTMKEALEKEIDFSGGVVSFNKFLNILQQVETGKRGEESFGEDFKIACDFLEFSIELPKGAFGAVQWEQYFGLDVEAPLLPLEIDEILNSSCPFFGEKKVSETHVLVLVPTGITLNQLGELAKNSSGEHKTKEGYRFIRDRIQEVYGDTPVEKPYWVLMTRDVIPDSRGKTRGEQLKLAASVEGYEASSLIEAAACCFAVHVSSGERLLSDNPWTYTCCQETFGDWKLVVGGFAPAGLSVDCHYGRDYVGVGVVALRKF